MKVEVAQADVHDDADLARLLRDTDVVVNLVAILHGSDAEFERVHVRLPERLAAHREVMEVVPECQSPVYVHVEVEGTGPQAPVSVFLSAPREAPTTRGFAAILAEGMTGLDAAGVLAVPDDVPHRLGLERAVSMLRLRGMSGMLGRIQRQVREKAAV